MKKQNIIVVGIIAFILTVAVGYALFSETLTVTGTATATCDAASLTSISSDKNTLNVTVNKLEFPGAYVEFPVTVTSKGSIPAVLESISESGLTTDDTVKVTYTNLTELKNKRLEQNGTQTFTIKVAWDENSNNQKTYNFL